MNVVQKFFRNHNAQIVNAFRSAYSLVNPISKLYVNGVLA